jgi:hypothetical protein
MRWRLRLRAAARHWIVVLAFVENRPDDARVLVGDGDEGFSITDAIVQRDDPLLEARALLGRSSQSDLHR